MASRLSRSLEPAQRDIPTRRRMCRKCRQPARVLRRRAKNDRCSAFVFCFSFSTLVIAAIIEAFGGPLAVSVIDDGVHQRASQPTAAAAVLGVAGTAVISAQTRAKQVTWPCRC